MEMPVDLTNHMPKRLRSIFSQLCHKHSGSSSEVELVMEALCPHWNLSRPLQRFSLVPVPSWDLSFWAKAIGLQFFRTFRVESKACANIATYSLTVRSNRCWRTLKTRAKVATHSLTVASNRCLPHPTPPHHDRIVPCTASKYTIAKIDNLYGAASQPIAEKKGQPLGTSSFRPFFVCRNDVSVSQNTKNAPGW